MNSPVGNSKEFSCTRTLRDQEDASFRRAGCGAGPECMAEMYAMIAQLNREGITVIMISHDVDAAVESASHILHMGKKVFSERKRNI